MKELLFKISDKYEVGAILYDTWGYEQTNIDFYAIIKRSSLFVTIVKLKKEVGKEVSFMSKKNVPILQIDDSFKPIRKKIIVRSGRESGFSLRDYICGGWCQLWDGKEKISSHYA